MQLILLATLASANDRVLVAGHVYSDTMGVLVGTPVLNVAVDASEELEIGGRVFVDSITAASREVDTVTGASREVRKAGTVSAAWERGVQRASAMGELSVEPDWRSATVGAGAARDFAQRCTTVEVFGYVTDDLIQPDRTGWAEEDAERKKRTVSGRASFSQVLTPVSVASVTVDLTWVRGFQGNSWYADLVSWAEEGGLSIDEDVPDERFRQVLAGRYSHHLPFRAAVHPFVRLYRDDWGVESLTLELPWNQRLGESWIVGVRYRHYLQGAADHYRDSWTATSAAQGYHTLDYKYDAMLTQLVGSQLVVDLEGLRKRLGLDRLDTVSLHAAFDHYIQRHDDWTFTAEIGQAGLSTSF